MSLIFKEGWADEDGGAELVKGSAVSVLVGDSTEALEVRDDVVDRALAVFDLLVQVHLLVHTEQLSSISKSSAGLEMWEALSSASSRAWV